MVTTRINIRVTNDRIHVGGQLDWSSSVGPEADRMVHRMELKIRYSWSSDRQNATSNLNEPHDAEPTGVAL